MQNDLFKGIEVPTTDVNHAIKQGITKGQHVKKTRQKAHLTKRFTMIGSSAAAAILAAGLVVTPIGNVLAQVPFVGDYYQMLNMSVGVEMASEQLVTEINESVTTNGVTVTVTSAFYDGHFLGITFKATGSELPENLPADVGPEAGYSFDLFKLQDDTDDLGGTLAALTKEGDAYVSAIILENHNLQDLKTLPITFTSMAGVRGEWKFNVPVEASPSKTLILNETAVSANGDYAVLFSDVVINKASVVVNFAIQEQVGIEGEGLLFRSKVKTENDYASISRTDTTLLVLKKGVETETIILEPYFKVNNKEINLTPIELNLN